MGQSQSQYARASESRLPHSGREASEADQGSDSKVVYMSVGQLKAVLADVGLSPAQKEAILRMAKQAPPSKSRWRRSSSASNSSAGTAALRIASKRSTSSARRSDADKRSPRLIGMESERARSDIASDIDDVIYLSEAEHESVSAYSAWTSSSHRQPQRTLEQVMPGQWKIGCKIGTGSFGEVYTGINTSNGQLIAVKCLPLIGMEREMTALQREIEVMRSLKHPNVVQYLGAEIQQAEHRLLIFQEWVPGGSIQTLLHQYGPFEPGVVREYARQILHGLVYLHNKHIIHRDIKGGNILVDERGIVKLADFGACKRLGEDSERTSRAHTTKGSPYFMAPEVLLKQKYGRKADVWSFGGAVLQMATGKPPWYEVKAKTYFSLTNHIAQHEGPPTIPESLSPQLRAFLLRCFDRNPSKRPRAIELLNDPYLTENKLPTIALDLDAEMEPPHSPVPLERLIERLWTKVDPGSKNKPRSRRWFNFRRSSDLSNPATPRGNNDALSPRDSTSDVPDDDVHETKSRERLSSDSNSAPGSPVGALSPLSPSPELENYIKQRRHNRLRTLTGHGSVRLNLGVEPPSPVGAAESDDPGGATFSTSQTVTPVATNILAARSLEETIDSVDSLPEPEEPAAPAVPVSMEGWPEWAKKRYLDKQKQQAAGAAAAAATAAAAGGSGSGGGDAAAAAAQAKRASQGSDAASQPAVQSTTTAGALSAAATTTTENRGTGASSASLSRPARIEVPERLKPVSRSLTWSAAETAQPSVQVKLPAAIVTAPASTAIAPPPPSDSPAKSTTPLSTDSDVPRHETLEEYRQKRERKKKELQRQQKLLEQRSLAAHPTHQPADSEGDLSRVTGRVQDGAIPGPVSAPVATQPKNVASRLPPILISEETGSEDRALQLLADQVRSSTTTPVCAHVDYPSPFGTLRNSRNFERIPSGVLLHASSMNKRAMSHGSAENIWRAHQRAILVDIEPVLSSAEEKAMQEEASRSHELNEKIRRNRHRSVSWSIRMYQRLQTITDSKQAGKGEVVPGGLNASNPFGRCYSVGDFARYELSQDEETSPDAAKPDVDNSTDDA